MYRRSKRTSGSVLLVIALGIVAGFIYFVYDQSSPLSMTDVAPTAAPALQIQATEVRSLPEPVPTDESLALLIIPKANVGTRIIRVYLDGRGSWDVSHLGSNAGSLQGTAWIDQPGNIVLVGHVEMRDGSPGIFANLKHLEVGDEVLLVRSERDTRIYHVNDIRSISPDDVSVLYPSSENIITLITCDDYDFMSNTYHTRIVVTAMSFDS